MNCLSLNIRGLGSGRNLSDGKGAWVRKMRKENDVDFVLLQETQFETIQSTVLDKYWGAGMYQTDWVGASGRSGGLVSIWDSKRFTMSVITKRRWFMAVSGVIVYSGKSCTVINVYAPQSLVDKRVLRNELAGFIQDINGYWLVGGDFNCVRDSSERRNSKFNMVETSDFNEFLDGTGLFEYGLRGLKFTFKAGPKLSRIDRIFVSWDFFNDYPNVVYMTLPRQESDHCPLLLSVVTRNFGVKPFRFFNSWMQREGFNEVVSKVLKDGNYIGPPDLMLFNKLKKLMLENIGLRNTKASSYPFYC